MKKTLIFFGAVAGLSFSPLRTNADLVNGSFEDDNATIFLDFSSVTGWTDNVGGSFGGEVGDLNFVTHGNYGARIFSKTIGTFSGGDEAHISQVTDMTNYDALIFDYRLESPGGGPWNSNLVASLLVGGNQLWSSQTNESVLNQAVNLSGITGLNAVEFRLQAVNSFSGGGNSYWFQIDNVRLQLASTPEPSSLAMMCVATGILGIGCYRRRGKREKSHP